MALINQIDENTPNLLTAYGVYISTGYHKINNVTIFNSGKEITIDMHIFANEEARRNGSLPIISKQIFLSGENQFFEELNNQNNLYAIIYKMIKNQKQEYANAVDC